MERTIADARSLIGVLNFACAVIILGKAFMAHLYAVVQLADKEAKGQKAATDPRRRTIVCASHVGTQVDAGGGGSGWCCG